MHTLETLPGEILYQILVHCDLPTINSVSLSTRRLHTASRDSLLWQRFCDTDRKLIGFHPSAIRIPKDGYRAEYIYQRQLDQVVEECLRAIVDDPATRFERIIYICRLGLRCRPRLLEIFSHADYARYNLRFRYYASELIQAVSYRQAALDVLQMFLSKDRFDMFQFYLAFDAFQHGKSVHETVSSEDTYKHQLDTIKSYLMPIKTAFENATHNGALEHHSAKKHNPIETAARQLGKTLYTLNLILDIKHPLSRASHRADTGSYYLREVLDYFSTNSKPIFRIPSYGLMRAALYEYFARWIGLDASIVVMEFDTFVRIEDPARRNPTSFHLAKREGCFFADLNRAGKVREVEDLFEFIRIAKSNKMSLSPSATHEIIEIFSRECISFVFPRSHQSEVKSDCVLFLGAMVCSFLLTAIQRQDALGLPVPIEFEDSNTRRDLGALQYSHCSLKRIIQNSQTLAKQTLSKSNYIKKTTGAEYNEDRLMHRYSMAIPSITFQVPISTILLTDFLLPLSPTSVKPDEITDTMTTIINTLQLKDRRNPRVHPDSPIAKFSPGDVIYHPRTEQYGVIINTWLNTPMSGDGIIQYTAFMEGCHHLRVREPNIEQVGHDFHWLMMRDWSFFGVDIGIYCCEFKMLPNNRSSFILTKELLAY